MVGIRTREYCEEDCVLYWRKGTQYKTCELQARQETTGFAQIKLLATGQILVVPIDQLVIG